MSTAVNKVLVIGGGFSGMTAAIQLRRQGMAVDLIEIDRDWRPLGAGISIAGATLRALDKLGILDEVAREGYLSDNFDIYSPEGQFIAQMPVRPAVADKPLKGGGGILRPVLAKILAKATRQAGANIHLGCSFERIVPQGEEVEILFTDGRIERYDLVVAADGVHSSVRKTLFPDMPSPKPIHQSVWRAVLPRPAEIVRPSQWLGRVKVGVNPISQSQMYMFITEDRDFDEWIEPERWPDEMARLVREFEAPVLKKLVDELYKPEARIDYRPLANLLVPLPWHRDRVVLIGDTVHATTPHLASGACIGIEDAIVLAEELANIPDLEAALANFERRRWDRCRLVVENSARLCEIEKSGGDRNEHAALMRASMEALAEPI
ncbi:hypothetical protein GCM10011348_03660 [Marinobacterium nitratireducens]|uniref:FAD-binding domain-containing protein n=1 Tax=Marinobacterium nitratireducens TaxID=518897 RepID=A0A917Z7A6_9GAMM|nr:FAD-dependent oxidoreductase [Marinobacterium nitratireducens]GGO76440.1 hypothetical protein GCM10011348_03660 [Marinobacterium nitratireducens]